MKSEIEIIIIQRVKTKRMEKGLSQAALADYLDVSRGFIGDVENPRSRAKYNINHINNIAKVLGCSIYDLLPENPI